ncbi:hypothetical protein CPI31_05815 [Moraxella catarrhalis]|nr:hypothetical protein [Moraxella catarrhalis]
MRLDMTDTAKSLTRLLVTVLITAAFVYSCSNALDRQAEADYQQCLSWQSNGYSLNCKKGY